MLRYFITSKAKRNLLKLFLLDPEKSYYTREIARLTHEPLNAVRRELGHLETAGLLRSHMQGNLKYFEVVKDFTLLAEWQRIILNTPDVTVKKERKPSIASEPLYAIARSETTKQSPGLAIPTLVEHLKEKFTNIDSITMAIVHGEAARIEEIPAEGIDLLVIGDINKDNLLELIARAEDETGISINLTSMSRSDFDYRSARGDPFIRRIWSERKLVIKGRH
jgi:predicted transcriptional regulator